MVIGAVTTGLLLFGARFGVRFVARRLRPTEVVAGHASPCGALLWRTNSVTNKGMLDPAPRIVKSESTLELDGRILVAEVEDLRCVLEPTLRSVALVVLRDRGGRRSLSVWDTSAGTRRDLAFTHEVTAFTPSPNGSWVSAASSEGDLSVARVDGTESPTVVTERASILPTSVAWVTDAEPCWVATSAPPIHAELWCSKLPKAAPRMLARAAWTPSDVARPWIGVGGDGPHLCGEDLRPADVTCKGLSRSR